MMEGWAVDFLGPNVPGTSLIEMIKSRRPPVGGIVRDNAASREKCQALNPTNSSSLSTTEGIVRWSGVARR